MDLQRRYASRKDHGQPEGKVEWQTRSLTTTGKLLFAINAEMRSHSRTEKNGNGLSSMFTVTVVDDTSLKASTKSCLEPNAADAVSID